MLASQHFYANCVNFRTASESSSHKSSLCPKRWQRLGVKSVFIVNERLVKVLLFFLSTRNQAPCRVRCLWWFSQSKNWLHPIDRYQYSSCQSCSQTQWQTTSTKKEFHWKSHGDFMKKLKLLPRSGKRQWSLSSLVLYLNSLKQSMRYN